MTQTVPPAGAGVVIQSLWIGPELSTMERLSIESFLAHGHQYHLYSFDPVDNVPADVVPMPAEEILSRSRTFRYADGGSWSGFSNFFRYKLLLERGGWWFDTDFICLRPLDFAADHVFASEINDGAPTVTSGVIKAPKGSEVMAYCWDVCSIKDPAKLVWGETGPALIAAGVERYGLQDAVAPPSTFCPLPYRRWKDMLDPDCDPAQWEAASTIHLWNEMWRRAGVDKNAHHHPGSPYERFRRKFLGQRDRMSLSSVKSVFNSLI